MFEVGMHQAKMHLPEIIRKVEDGEECIITRHGKPVVRLSGVPSAASLKEKLRTLKALKRKYPLHASISEILSWKHEGHRW